MKFIYEDAQLVKTANGMPEMDENNQPKINITKYNFLRTLNTEEMFRNETGQEMNAQLAEVLQTLMNVEKDNPTPEDIQRVTSLDTIDAIHQVLKYMYAEKKGDILVQNEETRSHYEELDLYEKEVIGKYFRRI